MPRRPSEAAGVLIEMDFSGSIHLRYRDDLTRVHREMLDNVIDGAENSRFAVLDDNRPLQIFFGERGKHRIRVLQNRFQIVEQGRRFGAVSLREFTGAVALDRPASDAAEYPFGDVASEMNEEISNAVRALVRPRPQHRPRQRVDALSDLDRVLLGQPVPRSGQKILGDRHHAVLATAAVSVSRKTSSAN